MLLPPHTIAYENAYERQLWNTTNKTKTEGDDQKGMPTKTDHQRKIKILKQESHGPTASSQYFKQFKNRKRGRGPSRRKMKM